MNKLLTLLCCLFSSTLVFADSKNYIEYHRAAALADEAVVNGDYKDAIRQYQTVFDAYSYNNPIDCYVATQVASYAGDTASSINFIYKGLCFGLPVETINDNPHLASIFKKTDQHIVDSCWGVYKKGINTEARAAIIAIIQRDQALVHSIDLSAGETIYESDGHTLKAMYQPFYDSLLSDLVNLIRTYGFPAQKIAGTQNGDDTLFRVGPHSVFAYYPFVHHGNAWKLASDILWSELEKGNITPQMYGAIYESSNGVISYKAPIHYFASHECYEPQCKSLVKKDRLKEINKHRHEIGLGSYEVMEKKVKSNTHYFKWQKKGASKPKPFFDFQWNLSFQGIR